MQPARLPALPPGLTGLAPVYVGAAARIHRGGSALHQPPELWVRCAQPALRAACPELAPDEASPEHWRVGEWRVRAVEDVEAALLERGVPLDAFAVAPDGTVIDPLGGLPDLASGRIRVPEKGRLEADPSLLVQTLALSSELARPLEEEGLATLADAAGLVLRADRHRLREALTRLLLGRRPAAGLQVLRRTGLLPLVLPEVSALVDFHKSSLHHHKDVWRHTLQVVMQAVPRPEIRWAALLHDIAKTHTRSYAPGKKVHFFRHDELGALMVEGILARLRFPEALGERIRVLVLHHLRANLYDPAWSDSAVRRFAAEMGDVLPDLLALSRADVTSKRVGRRREAMHHLRDLAVRVAAVKAQDAARKPVVPKGLGTAIIRDLRVAPGPRVGDLRRACEEAVRAGDLGADPTVEACVAWLRDNALEGPPLNGAEAQGVGSGDDSIRGTA